MTLIDSFQNMSIRKGDTFHPNASEANDFWDPLESKLGAPPRSTTCPKSLEDLLIGAGERRTAELLRKVDKAVKDKSKVALGNVLTEDEVLPVPTFTVHDTDDATVRKTRTHSHGSDSGIGSSIDSLDAKSLTGEHFKLAPSAQLTSSSLHSTYTLTDTNEPLARITAATQQKGLSKYACEQIHKHIVRPILREDALKEFHPLIKDVPSRIGNKEIKNLRDLEKTLIFLAPVSTRILYGAWSCSFWRSRITLLHRSNFSNSANERSASCTRLLRLSTNRTRRHPQTDRTRKVTSLIWLSRFV